MGGGGRLLVKTVKYVAPPLLVGSGYLTLRRHHNIGMCPSTTTYYTKGITQPPDRNEMLRRMKEEKFDVVVIGGGATGAGVALDAATRGLNCALIEADDFSAGTSSKSTKLLHGGIRYLEDAIKHADWGQLSLVWEALEERAHALKTAPHMSSALPIIMPLYRWWQVPYMWFGVKVYDALSKLVTLCDTGVPSSFFISRANTLLFYPLLRPKGLKGSLVYFDGQHNDSRMNLAIALTSTIPGYIEQMQPAAIANHCEATQVLHNSGGQAIGVRVKDKAKNEEFNLLGKRIINCTGPACDTIRRLSQPDCTPLVTQAVGSHLVLPKSYAPSGFGMIVPKTSDGRVLFLLPWEDHTVIGTTDEPATLENLPHPAEREVEFLLREAASYLNARYETLKSDVLASWAGYRPLVRDPSQVNTAKLTRSHLVYEDPDGLVSLVGGKWTTYRRMAQDVIDHVVDRSKGLIVPKTPCRTKHLKVYSAVDTTGTYKPNDADWGCGVLPRVLARRYRITDAQARHLVRNYGFEAEEVCRMGKATNTLAPVDEGKTFLKAEVIYAIRREMAVSCSDVIARRMRLTFVDAEAARRFLGEVADMMAAEFKWSADRKAREIKDSQALINSMAVSVSH